MMKNVVCYNDDDGDDDDHYYYAWTPLNYPVVCGPYLPVNLHSPFLWLTMLTHCCIFHLDHRYHVFSAMHLPLRKQYIVFFPNN